MLVDTFMFYNEYDVLELRLEVLDQYVDRFVLVEAEVNHVGGPKPLYFNENKERYAKWLHKIEHVIVKADEAPKDENPWAREKYQRECVLRGLADVPNESIVMISDVDEIPDLKMVPYEKLPHLITSVHMWMFHYSLDYMFVNEPWFGTVITNCELFKRAGPNQLRDNRWKFPVFQWAGWHLSSFGDEKHVLNKMKTFAHALDNNGHRHLQTEGNIKQWIERGIFVDGKTELVSRPPEVPLPAPVEVLRRLNLGKFP
jgi:beta-1,4-mannosyl-glycoprotein beta-1,4-N-acetylglucosaminyltransferase